MSPQQSPDAESAWDTRSAELAGQVTKALRTLLEEKHLYQRVDVDFDDLAESPPPVARERLAELFVENCKSAIRGPWDLADNTGHYRKVGLDKHGLRPQVPDVKLFCERCNRLEAFNALAAEDMLGRDRQNPKYEVDEQTVQVFALSFLCQSCKSVPEVILVRRDGARLTCSGRAPMEHTPVPDAIPKPVKRYYRDAVIAYQCGQTLPGLFMLRTVIEQWVRSQRHIEERASDAIEAYRTSLPEDFRNWYPCLRKEYEDLSADLHAAIGSAELFRDAIRRIDLHFNARNLFTQANPDAFAPRPASSSPPPAPPSGS